MLVENRFLASHLILVIFLLYVPQAESRWYDQETLKKGGVVFQQNCAACHGENAEATSSWKQTDVNGNYPPPPLNGTAHTWHHSKDLLEKTILEGGVKIGGIMPGFKDKLSDPEIDSVIAYFQSKWSDDLYIKWEARFPGGEDPSISSTQKKEGNTSQDNYKITKLFKMRLGSDKVSEPVKTPVDGIYQARFGRNYGYLTGDGRYVFLADLIDLEQDQNLTKNARRNIETPAPEPLPAEITGNLRNRKMTDLLKARLGSNEVSETVKTPIDGIYQARFGSIFAYLTEDGRYVFMGNLIDLERGLNLTNIAKREVVKTDMNLFATEDKAIFPAVGPEKAVINIFTDTSCSTCKKLFTEVPKLQEAGISVHYLPYPDEGKNSAGYQTLRQVWCAEDKAEALTIGKGLEKGSLPAGDCTDGSLVDKGHALGIKVGVIGTPAIFKQNGEHIKGYVPYQKLIPRVLKN